MTADPRNPYLVEKEKVEKLARFLEAEVILAKNIMNR